MSTAILCNNYSSISSFPDVGFGEYSKKLQNYYKKEDKELKKAETLGQPYEILIQALYKIFKECSEEGWDGYNALPITEDVYIEAKRFIENLPLVFIPTLEIIPEPNGEIAFEWAKGKRQIFVASVIGRNEIIYAGLFGTNKTHGTEYYDDFLPSIIIENLKRLYF